MIASLIGWVESVLLSVPPEYGLGALFLGLLASGVGLPVPEDLYMIFGGLFTRAAVEKADGAWVFPVLRALAVLYVGVMIGDTVIYRLGARFGDRILTARFVRRFVTPERAEKVRSYYAKYGAATVFIARHTGPIRFVAFLMAGVSRMPFGRFIFWDSLAAILSVPIWFAIGYFFWQQRHELEKRVGVILLCVAVAALLGLVYFVFKRKNTTPGDG